MAESRRRGRTFAPLPPGIVNIRLKGESAAGLAAQITALPGVQVVIGPDEYADGRVYLTVSIAEPEVTQCPA